MSPSSHPPSLHHSKILPSLSACNLLQSYGTSPLLDPNIFLAAMFSNIPNLRSSVNMGDQDNQETLLKRHSGVWTLARDIRHYSFILCRESKREGSITMVLKKISSKDGKWMGLSHDYVKWLISSPSFSINGVESSNSTTRVNVIWPWCQEVFIKYTCCRLLSISTPKKPLYVKHCRATVYLISN